jgi:hypothetical protein
MAKRSRFGGAAHVGQFDETEGECAWLGKMDFNAMAWLETGAFQPSPGQSDFRFHWLDPWVDLNFERARLLISSRLHC